jgi:hypothetical protein
MSEKCHEGPHNASKLPACEFTSDTKRALITFSGPRASPGILTTSPDPSSCYTRDRKFHQDEGYTNGTSNAVELSGSITRQNSKLQNESIVKGIK